MKKTKLFMLVLTSAVLTLTPVTASAVSYTHLDVYKRQAINYDGLYLTT